MLRRQEEQRQEDEGEREKAIAAGRKEGRLFFSAEKVGRGRACFPSREGRSGRKSEASRPPGLRLPCSFERARCDSQSPIHHGAVGDREEEEGRRHGRVFSLQWGICFSGGGGSFQKGRSDGDNNASPAKAAADLRDIARSVQSLSTERDDAEPPPPPRRCLRWADRKVDGWMEKGEGRGRCG